MSYNRYVVCKAMDGKGGRDLICPVHGEGGGENCELVVAAPVSELADLRHKYESCLKANGMWKDRVWALEREIERLKEGR